MGRTSNFLSYQDGRRIWVYGGVDYSTREDKEVQLSWSWSLLCVINASLIRTTINSWSFGIIANPNVPYQQVLASSQDTEPLTQSYLKWFLMTHGRVAMSSNPNCLVANACESSVVDSDNHLHRVTSPFPAAKWNHLSPTALARSQGQFSESLRVVWRSIIGKNVIRMDSMQKKSTLSASQKPATKHSSMMETISFIILEYRVANQRLSGAISEELE